ncbi:MAG: ABC transporter ATP-binding protein, partial [Isosphaeraceae bacterium]
LVDNQGTVLLVSHDRAFLNDVVTSTLVIEDDGQVKEYEGGYDDYLRQRPPELAVQSRPNPDAFKKKTSDPPREQSRKLSFKERKELETLPGRIELLENAVQELHAAMADPSFYRKDRDQIAGARNRLEDLEHDLAAAYARWHALEELAG